tara:strand:- start:323 stop:952 length:630 start_codon:yes stop_codon:yes gene_type:complete
MFQKIHITKGSGKLGKSDTCNSAINSINVNTLTNEYCIKQSKNKNSICSVCYSINSLTSFRKNMVNPLQRNSELLSNNIIEFSLLPTILELYFRFDSHGELINLNHLQNYTNIALKNPHCNFALWSKRFDLIKKFFDNNQKPKNLILIYSNSKLDKPLNKLPKYFDKSFNNVTKENKDNFNINCNSKCVDCLLCYTHNETKTIIEKVKK